MSKATLVEWWRYMELRFLMIFESGVPQHSTTFITSTFADKDLTTNSVTVMCLHGIRVESDAEAAVQSFLFDMQSESCTFGRTASLVACCVAYWKSDCPSDLCCGYTPWSKN